ncbi:MAG: uroporphyrinogen decarboxylase, partial [Proteobacteria bacterium]|nr:uroporphyrinogen decarboxylase [Pseudomonadota bacterium]
MTSSLIQACKGKKETRAPFWFMRQAGRYLAEYREVRKGAGGFLDLCYDSQKAAQVTLQPIERFGMDAAIIFSDILVVPQALGAQLRFAEGEGPLLEPVNDSAKLAELKWKQGMLEPVYEALRLTRAKLPEDKTLIGFAGAPWTLACYMVQGKSDREFYGVRKIAQNDRRFFLKLIDTLAESVYQH